MNGKIAIIGCGNLGMSILNGLMNHESFKSRSIFATKRNVTDLSQINSPNVNVSSDNAKAIRASEIIIVALKPFNILEVLGELKYEITENHTIVSLATGITIDEIRAVIGEKASIFRAMPNTGAGVSESMTCICTDEKNEVKKEEVKSIFDAIGKTIYIDESLMESATVLGACGIAYVLRFIRAMIQGGIQIGFDAKTASTIVAQTVKGASELLIENKQHPEYEIDKVTTPKGCTIVGLNEMEHNGFSSSLIKGLVASFDKIEK
jgi:pyrroline-5-carboxylate reductase